MKTRKQILTEGFVIDDTCYPPLAYKGPRFNVTESFEILTELEEQLLIAANAVLEVTGATCDDQEDGGTCWVGMFKVHGNRLEDLSHVAQLAKSKMFTKFR